MCCHMIFVVYTYLTIYCHCNLINRKDAYGFFLEPVDTEMVTDYLTIIKQPMDFGTMRRKVAKNEYQTMDLFKVNHSLIC